MYTALIFLLACRTFEVTTFPECEQVLPEDDSWGMSAVELAGWADAHPEILLDWNKFNAVGLPDESVSITWVDWAEPTAFKCNASGHAWMSIESIFTINGLTWSEEILVEDASLEMTGARGHSVDFHLLLPLPPEHTESLSTLLGNPPDMPDTMTFGLNIEESGYVGSLFFDTNACSGCEAENIATTEYGSFL